jgi:hypothetical protein
VMLSTSPATSLDGMLSSKGTGGFVLTREHGVANVELICMG